MAETIDGGGPLVKGFVCRGRTVRTGNEKIYRGRGEERTEVDNPGKHEFKAGEEIELPRAEFDRLRGLGYVRFPDEPAQPPPMLSDPTSVTQSGAIGMISTARN